MLYSVFFIYGCIDFYLDLLQDLFKKTGYKNFGVYLPQRNSEGYGLNMFAIKEFADSGVKLLITIDLGITAIQEVAQAEALGIDDQQEKPHGYNDKRY